MDSLRNRSYEPNSNQFTATDDDGEDIEALEEILNKVEESCQKKSNGITVTKSIPTVVYLSKIRYKSCWLMNLL